MDNMRSYKIINLDMLEICTCYEKGSMTFSWSLEKNYIWLYKLGMHQLLDFKMKEKNQ